ncbi:MAG: YiiX/YebB-like N1pC/P60 family cysteine hydrolase [Pseudomonadota bacterium]
METTGCPKLDADLQRFNALIDFEPTSGEDLERTLVEASTTVAHADLDAYDLAAIRAHGKTALDDMLALRVSLSNRVQDWHARGLMTRPAQKALRNVFRDGRYATDMIGELVHDYVPSRTGGPGERGIALKPPQTGFTGGRLQTLTNPRFGEDGTVDVRSGDVLLVRGMLANSAAIARIGDVDTQFSHIGLIHVDDHGDATVVEALIESGVTLTPLVDALNYDLARAVILRARDPRIGEAAAELALAFVKRARSDDHPHIPYDFTMELTGYRELYCSKLIRLAFAAATDGALLLPTFRTRLDMANRTFFDQIGVTARETFAPSDIELEPGFEIVAEWRDYRNTALTRNQDVVLDMMFYWMDTHSLALTPTLKIRAIGWLGRLSAYLPNAIKKRLKTAVPTVPRNMPKSAIEAVAMLDSTVRELTEHVMGLDQKMAHTTGRPLHPREAYEALEVYRRQRPGRIGYLRPPPR